VGKTPEFSVLHDRPGDPVDLRVAADGLVERVDHDDLEVLVGRVLADPVRAEDAEALDAASDALLKKFGGVVKVCGGSRGKNADAKFGGRKISS
jgi:hypothetical protein